MNHAYNTETQNIISFCSGYGGIELGLRLAGLDARTVCYVEIEAFAQANLVAKIEEGKMDAAPIWTDLKTFPARKFSGRIHGIIGGYPCQPFSAAGQRKGAEDPRHLFPYIREHIRTIRPLWCFFENVRGHVSLGLREVKRDLEQLGYTVEAGIFSAEEVGAPHRRERIFILAYSEGYGSGRNSRKLQKKDEPEKEERQKGRIRKPNNAGQGKELGNPECRGREGGNVNRETTEVIGAGCHPVWPARPSEEQFKWEEPRTVSSEHPQTKSFLGSTIDGVASRVDQLRLLGNGVVPQTAAKAWITLNKQ